MVVMIQGTEAVQGRHVLQWTLAVAVDLVKAEQKTE
jgi:hypothetical protein